MSLIEYDLNLRKLGKKINYIIINKNINKKYDLNNLIDEINSVINRIMI